MFFFSNAYLLLPEFASYYMPNYLERLLCSVLTLYSEGCAMILLGSKTFHFKSQFCSFPLLVTQDPEISKA